MEHTRLGDTGLRISRLALGCMSYGDPATEGAHRWALADDDAAPFFRQALDLGINFWDTANGYNAGTSEEAVGRALGPSPAGTTSWWRRRCTSRFMRAPAGPGCPARRSSSRSTPPWPGPAPTTSTCTRSTASTPPPRSPRPWARPCTTSFKRGKARYLGASSMYAWPVRQAAARRRPGRLDPVRVHAEPVQPAAPPGRARADGHVRRHRRRPGALLPPRQRPPGPPLGRAVHPVQRRPRSRRAFDSPLDEPVVNAVQEARSAPAASPWPRSRSPACCATRPSAPRSSARPDPTSPARSHRRARAQTDRRRGRHARRALQQPRAVLVLIGPTTRSAINPQGASPVVDNIEDFRALDPFFRIIEEGLRDYVDGDHFFDLLAEDVVFDFVITVPGYPRNVAAAMLSLTLGPRRHVLPRPLLRPRHYWSNFLAVLEDLRGQGRRDRVPVQQQVHLRGSHQGPQGRRVALRPRSAPRLRRPRGTPLRARRR